jgi:hypothetical protein
MEDRSFAERMAEWDRELMRTDAAGCWTPPGWESLTAGSLLRGRRRFEGLSQRELAALSGVDQGDICRLERGSDWRWSILQRLAESLDCELVLRLRPRDPTRPPSRSLPTCGRRRPRGWTPRSAIIPP